jgi:hypothetical protein
MKGFQSLLKETLDQMQSHPKFNSGQSPQLLWDHLKSTVKILATQYSKRTRRQAKDQLLQAQTKRSRLLDDLANYPRFQPLLQRELQKAEDDISEITQRETNILCLRTATRWQEKGERNNSYFYKVLKQRTNAQSISQLRHPITGVVSSEPQHLLDSAQSFYSSLFTSEPLNEEAIQTMISAIPTSAMLSKDDSAMLTAPFTTADLQDVVAHAPSGKSPGLDGLPFEIYSLLLRHPLTTSSSFR